MPFWDKSWPRDTKKTVAGFYIVVGVILFVLFCGLVNEGYDGSFASEKDEKAWMEYYDTLN